MAEVNNNINFKVPSWDLAVALRPPGSEGDAFGNLATNLKGEVVGGEAIGTATLASHLGYTDKDSIGSALDEIVALASQMNIALLVHYNGEEAMLKYIGGLDPALPSLPPVQAMLVIAERALQQGKIGGTVISSDPVGNAATTDVTELVRDSKDNSKDSKDNSNAENTKVNNEADQGTPGYSFANAAENFSKHTATQDAISKEIKADIEVGRANNNQNVTEATISAAKESSGNKWLSGNVYTSYLLIFMEMQRILMKNKVVQGKVEMNGMNLVLELARATADVIMELAKINQMIHIVTAVMSAVAIVVSIGGLGISFSKGFGTSAIDIGSMIGQLGAQLEKMATAAVQAATDLTIAEKEGKKEVLQAYRQIAQHQMDKAGEAFKADAEQINALIQALDKIRDGLQQAINSSLQK